MIPDGTRKESEERTRRQVLWIEKETEKERRPDGQQEREEREKGREQDLGMQSFSREVRQESAACMPVGTNAMVAELAAIAGNIADFVREKDGTCSVYLHTDNRAALTKFFTLLEKAANINFKFDFSGAKPSDNLTAGNRKVTALAQHSAEAADLAALLELDQESEDSTGREEAEKGVVSWPLIADENCARSVLRGMFLCIGMISSPSRGYRLEFNCLSEGQAAQIFSLLKERNIEVKQTLRRGHPVVYTSSAESIGDILTLIGARESLLHYQDARVEREIRGSVNRKVNCETSNIRRTVRASSRQIESIRRLQGSGRWKSLPENLRKTGEIRVQHPELSLEELGKLMDPPVGKSGVNHRLRKLLEVAEQNGEESTSGTG